MTDRDTLAVHVIALRILSDVVKERTAATKAELAGQMKPGERSIAQLPNGEEIGGISFTRGRGGARVTDEAAFTAWVVANYPSEVVTSVRSSFRDMVLANAKRDGAAVDRSGEVIPGVELYQSEPYLSAKPTPGASDAILAAVRLDQVLAIGAAPEWDSYDPDEQR